jgi:hypothetical protein
MSQFRWASKPLIGPWFLTEKEALGNALGHGQAAINSGVGHIILLRDFAWMEKRARVH